MDDDIKINIITQGAPDVNCAYAVCRGENIIALYIDMHSKYCDVSGTTTDNQCPALFITAYLRSLHLKNGVRPDKETYVSLPEFKGYEIFSYSVARYSIAVCLVKRECFE